jgi:hypothetical protein
VDLHKRLGISDSLLDAVKDITEKKHMDPVNPKALKKDFDDRKDKDIDNDGDVDKSDSYLHNRRKAIKKAMSKDEAMHGMKKSKMKGSKDNIDTEPQLDNKMDESTELKEESIVIHYRNPKDGKTHKMHVFTAQDARQAQMDLKRQGMNIIKTEMGEELSSKEKMKRGLYNKKEEMSSKEKMKRGLYNKKEEMAPAVGAVARAAAPTIAKAVVKKASDSSSNNNEEKSPTGVDDGAVDKHNCATHVYHEQWGNGQTITTMHAEPDSNGFVEWYDVLFDHGIEKGVPVAEMKVTREMSHGSHKKKK